MDRMRLALECAEIDEAGGSVRAYLASKGFISPWGTWYRLQIEELGRKNTQITEGKGGHDMRKVTLEQKKEAVKIALGGGDPLAYLKGIGSKQPSALWWTIKKGLQEADPEAYAKLTGVKKEEPVTCCAPSTRKGVEVPDEIPDAPKTLDGSAWKKWPAEPEEKPTVQLTVKAEDLKAVMEAPVMDAKEILKHTVVALEDDFRIYGLKTKIGDFQADGGRLSWHKTEEQMISMPVEDWKKILEVVPKVMAVMGL